MTEKESKAWDWIYKLIEAHENLMNSSIYSDNIYCYSIPTRDKRIPIKNLEKLASDAGFYTYMKPFGKSNEYPEYEGQLVCSLGDWELYELIRKKGGYNE